MAGCCFELGQEVFPTDLGWLRPKMMTWDQYSGPTICWKAGKEEGEIWFGWPPVMELGF